MPCQSCKLSMHKYVFHMCSQQYTKSEIVYIVDDALSSLTEEQSAGCVTGIRYAIHLKSYGKCWMAVLLYKTEFFSNELLLRAEYPKQPCQQMWIKFSKRSRNCPV